jgi:hypothetical protein
VRLSPLSPQSQRLHNGMAVQIGGGFAADL